MEKLLLKLSNEIVVRWSIRWSFSVILPFSHLFRYCNELPGKQTIAYSRTLKDARTVRFHLQTHTVEHEKPWQCISISEMSRFNNCITLLKLIDSLFNIQEVVVVEGAHEWYAFEPSIVYAKTKIELSSKLRGNEILIEEFDLLSSALQILIQMKSSPA